MKTFFTNVNLRIVKMFENAMKGELSHSEFIEAHLVNIPSSPVKS